jgi:dGTPase
VTESLDYGGRGTEALEAHLAPYAAHSSQSRGRRYPEPPPGTRTEFQRDRDRIVHSAAFRRLEYKTQVFVNHEGDLFRTRLTHSLEVAQIARSVARGLWLNEDLVEAIALAHDLGHTPFGHAGQDALNACMAGHGGFEHNLQSLAVVDELEEHYGAFNGLNLSFETREGILKHCSRENAQRLGEIGERFLLGRQPSLEAQIANLADEIAYNNHDIDDGVRSGLLSLEQLSSVTLWRTHHEAAVRAHPRLEGRRIVNETIRRIINTLIVDLIQTTLQNLRERAPTSLEAVRAAPPLVGHSAQLAIEARELKSFLFKNLYRHYRVMRMAYKAGSIVTALFDAFVGDPRLLPPGFQAGSCAAAAVDGTGSAQGETGSGICGPATQPRLVAHYIAGMTDRYAMKEYRRLFVVDGA